MGLLLSHIVLEDIAETARVCHMSLKLRKPIGTVVDPGLEAYAMFWAWLMGAWIY